MQNAAFRFGLIIAFFVTALPIASAKKVREEQSAASVKGESSQQHHPASPAARKGEPPPLIPDHSSARSGGYQYACDSPETREDAEACENRRSAGATVKQAEYAGRQTDLSEYQLGLGAIGLAVSLAAAVYTLQAARAARDAAIASQDSAAEARKSNAQNIVLFEAERRPWLGIESVKFRYYHVLKNPDEPAELGITLEICVKNYGATPAINVFGKSVFFPSGTEYSAVEAGLRTKLSDSVTEDRKILSLTVFPEKEAFVDSTATTKLADGQKSSSGVIAVAICYLSSSGNIAGESWCAVGVGYRDVISEFTIPLDMGELLAAKFTTKLLPFGRKIV